MNVVTNLDLPGFPKIRSGKVRELFDVGEFYLLVATDRLSAFDCILPDPIPNKGTVLNQLSAFWFRKFADVPSHFVTDAVEEYPAGLKPFSNQLRGRSMLVKKAEPLPLECVVRGYLAGSSWHEYQDDGKVSGIDLPPGLEQAAQLPSPIFTPATKADQGHDENISWEECIERVTEEQATRMRDLSMALYADGSVYAGARGIIIADTKFEFGLAGETLLLIDECLTPDSSRFWPADEYKVGSNPVSFDKQFVRDYLEELGWNKQPPAPNLAPEIIAQTSIKYQEAFERLTAG
jgi:phosphoribosylaminoimidazole-succinocarboxamide synthase